MATKDQIVRQLGGIKQSITKRRVTIFGQLQSVTSTAVLNTYIDEFNEKIKTLHKLENEFNSVVSKISSNETFELEIEKLEKDLAPYHSTAEEVLSALETKLISIKRNDNHNVKLPFKLPTIEVPYFSGNDNNCLEFFHFRKSFDNALKASACLTDDQKQVFLRSRLRGTPLSMIENLSSFDESMKLLTSTFQNDRAIIDHLMGELLNFSPVKNLSQVTSCLTNISFKLADLRSLGVSFDSSGNQCFLARLLKEILPAYFYIEIIRRVSDTYPSVSQILDNYHEVVTALSVKSNVVKSDLNVQKKESYRT